MKTYNKREIAIFNQLKDRVNEYLMPNEFIESEYFAVVNIATGIFITNLRVIILSPGNAVGGLGKPKVKKINIDSINYANIESISYKEGVLGFDNVDIKIKGSLRMTSISISKNISKNLYNDLNQKLMGIDIAIKQEEILEQSNLTKSNKAIRKEETKEKTKKVANFLGEKTVQFSKWGAKQIKDKSEQLIQDINSKKENN